MNLLEALAGEAFCRVADARQSAGNQVRLLRDGPETYPAWLDAIAGAAQTVDLENYILQDDSIGRDFAAALKDAAKRGVRCRVLYDWLGCLTRTPRRFWTGLAEAGAEIRAYNPPHLKNPLGWISRDHRKVLQVDGVLAFTGGLCIGHDWAGDPARGIAPWRDTAIEIRGPAVADIAAAFADSWAAAGATRAPGPSAPPPPPFPGGVDLSVIDGHPNSMSLYRLEQLVAEIAQQSLWLSDGYFVATTGYVRALSGAARAGVDVRLLVPGSSNWPIVGALSQSAYRPLLESGVRVFEWNGPMMHAKTAVADGIWTRIGSSNSNLASWVSNRELDVTVRDRDLAGAMEAMFEQDMANATEVVLRQGEMRAGRPAGIRPPRRHRGNTSRFLASAVGFSSTLGATLSQHRVLGPAESFVLLGGGVLLLALALVALLVPAAIAWPFGVFALWVAAGLLAHAWKLLTSRDDRGGP